MRRFEKFLDSHWVLIVIMILAAAVRLRSVGTSLCMDDWAALRDSLHIYPSSVEKFRPFFFSLLYLWRCIGPDADWWLQLLPFLLSVGCIPLVWLVGQKLGGRRIAAALALLMALTEIHLDLSAEVRIYALMSALGLLQLLCFLRLRERTTFALLAANTLVGVIAIYTQPVYGLYLLGLFVLAIWERREFPLRLYFVSLAAMAVCYIPNVFVVLAYAKHVQSTAHAFSTHAVGALYKLVAAYTTGFTFFRVNDLGLGSKIGFKEIAVNIPLVILWVAAFGLIAVGAIRRLRRPEERFARHVILTLLVLPFGIAYAGVLLSHRNLTHAPFHLTSLPVVLFLVIKGVQGWDGKRAVQVLTAALYAMIVLLSSYRFLFDSQHYGRRTDWHQAAQYAEHNAGPETPLLLLLEKPGRPADYPYLMRYGYDSHFGWRWILAPADSISKSNYESYLKETLAPYREVSYLWEVEKKDLLDPRNVVVQSMKPFAANETVDIINPRLAIYRWTLKK